MAQRFDLSFKLLLKNNPNGFLKMININEEIDYELPSNYVLKNRQLYIDYGLISKTKKLFHLEFESKTPTKEDIKRHIEYVLNISEENEYKCVNNRIMLFNGAKIPKIKNYSFCNSKIPLNYVDLNRFNGDKILNTIENKIKYNEITDEDKAKLSVISMFSTKMNYNEYLLKAAKLTQKLKIDNKDLQLIMTNQILLSQTTDIKTQNKILETFRMTLNPVERFGQEQMEIGFEKGEKSGYKKGEETGFEKGEKSGYKKGEETGFEKGEKSGYGKGMEKTNLEIAKRMKNNGYSLNEINKITGLSFNILSIL